MLEADRLQAEGLSQKDALLAARRAFGNPTRARERFYESRQGAFLDFLVQDVQFGLRMLAKNSGTTLLAVLTIALALGVNTAVFSLLDAALLRSLPVRNPAQLVTLTDPNASMVLGGLVLGGLLTGERSLLTYPEYLYLQRHTRTLSGLCAAQLTFETWFAGIAGGKPEQVRGRLLSEDYFSVLGVQPAWGRFFSQRDGKRPYVVISYEFWQKRFAGSSAILGTPIRLHQAKFEVIGVTPPEFRGTTVGENPDLWLPMNMAPLVMPGMDGLKDTIGASQDKLMWLQAFGRRKAGVTMRQSQAEMNVLFGNLMEADYPVSMHPEARREALHQYIVVRPLANGAFHGRKEFQQQWLLLLALASLVLLVACANVANLLLAGTTARGAELAIRPFAGSGQVAPRQPVPDGKHAVGNPRGLL